MTVLGLWLSESSECEKVKLTQNRRDGTRERENSVTFVRYEESVSTRAGIWRGEIYRRMCEITVRTDLR